MTDFYSRLIDISLEEELGGDAPPDQVHSILRAAMDRQSTSPPSSFLPKPNLVSQRVGRVNYRSVGGRIAVAACVLVCISLASFFIPRGGQTISEPTDLGVDSPALQPITLVRRSGFVVPASADTAEFAGSPVLRERWAYVSEESDQVLVGISQVKFQNARAVVKFGSVPKAYEAAAIAYHLRSSDLVERKEELEMLLNPKRWIAGLGVALCLFVGQATLENQPIQAQEDGVTLTDVFNRFDLDGNGSLSADECVCKCSKKCDLNDDGTVTREEFAKGVAKLAGSHENLLGIVAHYGGLEAFYTAAKTGVLDRSLQVSMKDVFAFLDKNGDGGLEKSECICHGSKNADLDADGRVTPEELTSVAVKFFGSEQNFLNAVRQQGGVEGFFASVTEEKSMPSAASTLKAVFAQYDKNGNGSLEPAECVCKGSKMADFDKNGSVTREEFSKVVLELFGSHDQFCEYITSCGGPEKFYAAVVSGQLPPKKSSDR